MATTETDPHESPALVIADVKLMLQTLADREAAFRAKADREKVGALRIATLALAGTPEAEIRRQFASVEEYRNAAARLRRATGQDLVGAQPVADVR